MNIKSLLRLGVVMVSMSAACSPPNNSVVTCKPTSDATAENTAFTLTSSSVNECGTLPAEFTCDGASVTLPLAWRNAPAGTQSFAVVMHHIPGPGDTHWYWVLYDIPANVHSLAKNTISIGTLGNNSVNSKPEYAPPCSKGAGAKMYTYTLYALSSPPQLSVPAAQVSREVLLNAIKDRTLGSAVLNVVYTR